MIRRLSGICFLSIFFLVQCHTPDQRTVHRSFYFWRTVFDLDHKQQEELNAEGIERLYTRFFDLVYDPVINGPVPQADIAFQTVVITGLEVVPVVYITNEVFEQLGDSAVAPLSLKIMNRIGQLADKLQQPAMKEVQLDCDWTATTRDRYFSLINCVKQFCVNKKILVSATIRLHQVKYYDKTGVPPADRGMLMFYNMGKVDDIHSLNSIYDPAVASRYLVNFNSYPLPLDVALPFFSWAVVFNGNHIAGLISNKEKEDLDREKDLEIKDATHYLVLNAFQMGKVSLLKGETLRLETAGPGLCDQAAVQIAPHLQGKEIHVSIFDLKKNQINTDEKEILDKIYGRFK
ncbi:MAG: hypothetical protein ACHQRM_04280 [Bacteroidia bacterium]